MLHTLAHLVEKGLDDDNELKHEETCPLSQYVLVDNASMHIKSWKEDCILTLSPEYKSRKLTLLLAFDVDVSNKE